MSGNGRVLAGFDFPIGLPRAFGNQIGIADFQTFLSALDEDKWQEFFIPARSPEEISLHRPFYPQTSFAGSRQSHLYEGLGLESFDSLRRECEFKTERRRAACPIFWTLGGNQVGKAAIDGWKTIIRPAIARGASLWPFRGTLNELSEANCVLCETYPGEAYAHIGLRVKSKRDQLDRRCAASVIFEWAQKNSVIIPEDVERVVKDGFGKSKSGEDPFDALIGLLSMIEVVEGRRKEGAPQDESVRIWEGWILGQER